MANVKNIMRDHKKYYQKNRAKILANGKRYREKNKEKESKRRAKYYLKNKVKIADYNRKRYAANKDKILSRFKSSRYYQSRLKGTNDKVGSKTKDLWKDPEYRRMMSEAHKGKPGYWTGKKIPDEAKKNMSEAKRRNPTKYWLNKKCLHSAGEKNPGYIHGRHPENKRQRHTMEYARWRRTIFERDNFTCQECNVRGGKLHADHIKPFALFPELRFELTNGRTLCEKCHRATPTYGKKFDKTEYSQ